MSKVSVIIPVYNVEKVRRVRIPLGKGEGREDGARLQRAPCAHCRGGGGLQRGDRHPRCPVLNGYGGRHRLDYTLKDGVY